MGILLSSFMDAFPKFRVFLLTSPYRDEVQVPVDPRRWSRCRRTIDQICLLGFRGDCDSTASAREAALPLIGLHSAHRGMRGFSRR